MKTPMNASGGAQPPGDDDEGAADDRLGAAEHTVVVDGGGQRHRAVSVATVRGGEVRNGPGTTLTGKTMTSRAPQITDDVIEWRRRRLRAAGFPGRPRLSVARDCTMDLHALLALVDRGCPPPRGPDPRAAAGRRPFDHRGRRRGRPRARPRFPDALAGSPRCAPPGPATTRPCAPARAPAAAARFELRRRARAASAGDSTTCRPGRRRRAHRVLAELAELPRREPLHHLGLQVRPLEAAVKRAPPRLAAPRGRRSSDDGWPVLGGRRRRAARRRRTSELLRAVQDAIATALTPHQRPVLVALTLQDVPIDVLAERLGTHARRPLQDPARRATQAPRRARAQGLILEGASVSDEPRDTTSPACSARRDRDDLRQCFDQLDVYVELERAGARRRAGGARMRAHLAGCPACAEDHTALRALARRGGQCNS